MVSTVVYKKFRGDDRGDELGVLRGDVFAVPLLQLLSLRLVLLFLSGEGVLLKAVSGVELPPLVFFCLGVRV